MLYAEWKKPDTKGYTSRYTAWFHLKPCGQNKTKQTKQTTETEIRGVLSRGGMDYKGVGAKARSDKKALYLDHGGGHTLCIHLSNSELNTSKGWILL